MFQLRWLDTRLILICIKTIGWILTAWRPIWGVCHTQEHSYWKIKRVSTYSGLIQMNNFYTPVWKTGRIMPWQCPSVRRSVPSVRPSVRPRFPDFSSTCFEISIWNLVYTFSRWHDMSSLSCITIGSLWPSLQPKVGQTYFLQSWPHKSR